MRQSNGDGKGRKAKSAASVDHVLHEQRKGQAIELRKGGATYREIGAALQLHHGTAQRLVIEALDEMKDMAAESAGQLRDLELRRLDEVWRNLWVEMRQAAADRKAMPLQLIDRLVRISESRRKLLGLDAPQQVQLVGGVQPLPIEHLTEDELAVLEQLADVAEQRAAAAALPTYDIESEATE